MIGPKFILAALLLLSMASALSLDLIAHELNQTAVFLNQLVPNYCDPDLQHINDFVRLCDSASKVAFFANNLTSTVRCSHRIGGVKFDPVSGLCQSPWEVEAKMIESQVWPNKDCDRTTTCYAPLEAHWNPYVTECTCAIATFSNNTNQDLATWEPRSLKAHNGLPYKVTLEELHHQAQKVDNSFRNVTDQCAYMLDPKQSSLARIYFSLLGVNKLCRGLEAAKLSLHATKMTLVSLHLNYLKMLATRVQALQRLQGRAFRSATPDTVPLAPIPAFIPPPNTQVTQELIQESLLIQPQQVAVVGSVIPQFADGVITFLVQLDGPISQTLAINATDTLPCDTIGSQPQPNLVLVPKIVVNGTSKSVLPTCLIIAVNMYDPKYITYWVLRQEDGTVHSLLSDNKIHAIDQLDTSKPISVAVQVATDNKKRDGQILSDIDLAPIERRQVYSIACGTTCPFHFMQPVHGDNGYCGCLMQTAGKDFKNAARGLEKPTPYTVTMTAEACAAMKCLNNDGKPAIFNPFTATCWCASPAFVEENDSAYNGRM